MDSMDIANQILNIRKEQKLTQEEFGRLFYVTRQTVSNWENGKSYPDLQILVDISNRFEISLGYFHPMQTYYVGELLDQVSVPVEEDHEFVWMDYNELVDNMYLEMQSWALEQCMKEIL